MDAVGEDFGASAAALPQTVHPLDPKLLDRAVQLRQRIRIIDGLYVALAERLNAPLLATHRRLAASNPPCECLAPGT